MDGRIMMMTSDFDLIFHMTTLYKIIIQGEELANNLRWQHEIYLKGTCFISPWRQNFYMELHTISTGNITRKTSWPGLMKLIEKIAGAPVVSAYLGKDRETGKLLPWANYSFLTSEAQQKALSLNGKKKTCPRATATLTITNKTQGKSPTWADMADPWRS